MKRRKNISIQSLIRQINSKLTFTHISQEEKAGYCVLLENILQTNNVYWGFCYLPPLWDENTRLYQFAQKGFEYNREYSIHPYLLK